MNGDRGVDREVSGWGGHDPDVLGSLAAERVHLAWNRTALSWGGAGAATVRYFADDGLLRPSTAIGFAMLTVGALSWAGGAQEYRRTTAAIRADEPVRVRGGVLRAMAWLTTMVCLAVIAVELSR